MKTQVIPAEDLLAIIDEKEREIARKDQRITELEQHMQWLISQIKLAKNKQFGSSSEKSDVNSQLSVFNEAESLADMTIPEPELAEVKSHYRKRTRLTTDKLPDDIPVEIIEHEIPEEQRICSCCGSMLHEMGTDVREELKIIPAKAVIVRHVQHVYSCRYCENNSDHVPIVKAVIPEPAIKGGFASAETIAHIAVQKFMMASPLYRQEQEWKQNGILLSRQTMSNWLIKACEGWLVPIYERMKEKLLKHRMLHADETSLNVLKEPGKQSQGKKSYMWLYRTSGEAEHNIVIYEYQPDRKQIRPERFLKDFKGYLHADGYGGYHNFSKDIIVVGCLAHLRRKFFDALKTLPKERQKDSNAKKAVDYCDTLFLLERQFASCDAETRYMERQRQSKPLFDEFYVWMSETGALPKSLLGVAMQYAATQKKYIER